MTQLIGKKAPLTDIDKLSDGLKAVWSGLDWEEWRHTGDVYLRVYRERVPKKKGATNFLVGSLEDLMRRGIVERKPAPHGGHLWRSRV